MFKKHNMPRPSRLIIISILVISFTFFILSSPRKIACTLRGAEVDLEGNVMETGTLSIEGRMDHRLFETRRFRLTGLELPGCQVGAIYESAYPLYEMINMPGNYHTFASIELAEYSFATVSSTDIFFSEDHDLWIISVMGRIFVGTTDQNPNYAQIMEFWRNRLDSIIEN